MSKYIAKDTIANPSTALLVGVGTDSFGEGAGVVTDSVSYMIVKIVPFRV
jgi:hypothetical protein